VFERTDCTNADFTGADLSEASWFNVTCPDGTNGDTNGSSPPSCCDHLNGKVPSACTPCVGVSCPSSPSGAFLDDSTH